LSIGQPKLDNHADASLFVVETLRPLLYCCIDSTLECPNFAPRFLHLWHLTYELEVKLLNLWPYLTYTHPVVVNVQVWQHTFPST